MRVKQIVSEDFVNYKKPAMFVGTCFCSGKCPNCQNEDLMSTEVKEISDVKLCRMYFDNKITKAIVFGGLEPFDQFSELNHFIILLRVTHLCNDDIVIYTGYYPKEVEEQLNILKLYPNIIVKFGRYIPDDKPVFDDVLGVELASHNQYAMKIS